MKPRLLFFIYILFSPLFFLSQNNLIIFSENIRDFQINYQNKIYPNKAQTDVKITQITDNPVSIKIIFSNQNLKPIDTTLYLFHPSKPIQNQDIIYLLSKDNKTLRYLTTLPSSDIKPLIPEIDTSIVVRTKEEKSIQKIIFLNDSNAVCLNPIDSADFNKAIQHIIKTPNVDRKIVLIEQFIKHNCFNPFQAQTIIEQVPFEVEKLKISKMLVPRLTNVFNLWHWKDFQKYPTAQQSFTEFYSDFLYNLKKRPALNDSLLQITIQSLSNTDNDLSKSVQIQTILSHYSIQLNQLESFVNTLKHDQYKEEILKYAFYNLNNKNDFMKAIQFVNFNETKQRLKNYYEQKK